MEFKTALEAHYAWRQRFRDAIEARQTFDVDTIAKDNQCALGKWLYDDAALVHGALPDYAAVINTHAAFHTEAARLAALVNKRHFAPVLEELAGGSTPYANASTAVNMALMRMFRTIDA